MYVDETEQPTEESKYLLMDPEWTAETSATQGLHPLRSAQSTKQTYVCKVRVFFGGRDAGMSVDLSAAEMVAAEKDNIEESKKGVPSKTKQGRCAKQKNDVIEAP